jgi:hypothetical protein
MDCRCFDRRAVVQQTALRSELGVGQLKQQCERLKIVERFTFPVGKLAAGVELAAKLRRCRNGNRPVRFVAECSEQSRCRFGKR